jgi:hypothetical protein
MALDARERPKSAEDLGRTLRKFVAGIDLGDVARGLGERVRRRRSLMKPTPMGAPSRRGVQPSQSELVTKTFAARAEVEKWKSEAPPSADGPSTRKVDSTAPPSSDASGEDARPRDGGRIETIATRPLETPVEQHTVRRPRPGDRWRLAGIALLVVGAASGFIAWRVRSADLTTTPVPIVTTSVPSTSVTASATTSVPVPTTAATPSATTSASGAPEAGRAWFSLFGDPGTRVSIDGVQRGSVPLQDLAVEPGDHDIRFTFDAIGESSGKRVAVRAGERVCVRADFTGASPSVQVQR